MHALSDQRYSSKSSVWGKLEALIYDILPRKAMLGVKLQTLVYNILGGRCRKAMLGVCLWASVCLWWDGGVCGLPVTPAYQTVVQREPAYGATRPPGGEKTASWVLGETDL